MTYWLVNSWFLAAVVLVVVVALILRRSPRWGAVLGALVIVGVLTVVFDNAIIGFGIVDYDPTKISGFTVGLAPIEDFAYTLAAAIVIPTVFCLLGRRSGQ